MFTIQPDFRSRMPGSTICARWKEAKTCTSNISFCRRSGKSSTGMKKVTAALFTRMSTGPYASSVALISSTRSSSFERSQRTASASPPACLMRSTTPLMLPGSGWSPSSTVRAETTTFAPSIA